MFDILRNINFLNNQKSAGGNMLKRFTSSAVIIFMLASVIGMGAIYLGSQKPVEVYVDGELYEEVRTTSRTPQEVFAEIDLEVDSKDRVNPSRDEILTRGKSIKVEKTFPVYVLADGEKEQVWTPKLSVGELLKEVNLELGELDEIEPEKDEKLEPYDEVKITRVERIYTTSEREVPYESVYRNSSSLDRGNTRVVSDGEDGVMEEKIEKIYKDGEKVEEKVVEENIIKEPSDEVLERGTRDTIPGEPVEFEESMQVEATAYCPCGQCGSGTQRTATGARAEAGSGTENDPHLIAVDPQVIPLGTKVYLEDYGYAVAQDTGGAIRGKKIDLLFSDHGAASSFGRRSLKLYVISN